MTKANILRKFFKKFFDYDATGNSATSVIADVVANVESMPGGSGGGAEPLIIKVKEDNIWELDHTFNDVKNAIESGRTVIYQAHNGDDTMNNMIVAYYYYEDNGSIYTANGSEFYSTGLDNDLVVPD